MKIERLEDKEKGWIVGDFDKATIRTDECEVAAKYYKAGDKEPYHYHKIATEVTVIAVGEVIMRGERYGPGTIITIYPYEATDFLACEDTITLVYKNRSVPGDKYIV